MKNKYKTDQSGEKQDPALLAIDGLLLEMGRNGTGNDSDFLRGVMDSVSKEEDVPPVQRHHFFRILRTAASLAAVLAMVSAVAFVFYYRISSGAVDDRDKMPCILACSPGGLIKSGNKEKAIVNGMNLKADDTVHVFKSKSAFVQVSDLASMEIGAGSIIQFKDMRTITDRRKKLSGLGITLKNGIIRADISGLKDGSTFTAATAQGVFTTQKSSFILIETPELCFMEVKNGSVRFKDENGLISVINAGQSKVVRSANTAIDSSVVVNEYRSRLTLQSRDIGELLAQLAKKKKADICLKEIIRKRNISL
ncbi:MAG: hypothetical protein WCS96_06980 [Victivallales bacterium]